MSDSLFFILLSMRVKDVVLFKRFVALRNLACCCTASYYNKTAASHREALTITYFPFLCSLNFKSYLFSILM